MVLTDLVLHVTELYIFLHVLRLSLLLENNCLLCVYSKPVSCKVDFVIIALI